MAGATLSKSLQTHAWKQQICLLCFAKKMVTDIPWEILLFIMRELCCTVWRHLAVFAKQWKWLACANEGKKFECPNVMLFIILKNEMFGVIKLIRPSEIEIVSMLVLLLAMVVHHWRNTGWCCRRNDAGLKRLHVLLSELFDHDCCEMSEDDILRAVVILQMVQNQCKQAP